MSTLTCQSDRTSSFAGASLMSRIDVRTWGRRYLAAQVVAFLWYMPYLAKFLEDESRFLYMWEPADVCAVLGAMVAVAVVATLSYGLVLRTGKARVIRLYEHAFLVVLAGALLDNLVFHMKPGTIYPLDPEGWQVQTLWMIVMVVVGASLARPAWRLVRRARQFCQVVSPIVPILLIQLLQPVYYPPGMDPLPRPAVAAQAFTGQPGDATPIYLFIFDEWSYDRTYDRGALTELMPELADLSARATVFHDAHSPGPRTFQSIPNMLYQTPLHAGYEAGRYGFRDGGELVGAPAGGSIFSLVPDHYSTALIAFCQPFQLLLGGEVDSCRCYRWQGHGEGVLAKAAAHTFKATQKSTDPWGDFVQSRYSTAMYHDYAERVHDGIHADTMYLLADAPRSMMAVIHYPLPHKPYMWNADGTSRGATDAIWHENVDNYRDNLRQLDRVIGEIAATLESSHRFDATLLIIVSDHAWRRDPDNAERAPGDWQTHVPAIVKFPGQHEGLAITDRFELLHLGDLIAAALRPDASAGAIVDELIGRTSPPR